MNEQLLKQIQAASQDQPAWLQQKRQLAMMRAEELPTDQWQTPLLDSWSNHSQLTITNEQGVTHTDGYVDLPIFKAAQQYPELLQENLMEKAIDWQASQVNALHLALLNGGRFIYIPDGMVI